MAKSATAQKLHVAAIQKRGMNGPHAEAT